jgi:hypothetical protein
VGPLATHARALAIVQSREAVPALGAVVIPRRIPPREGISANCPGKPLGVRQEAQAWELSGSRRDGTRFLRTGQQDA